LGLGLGRAAAGPAGGGLLREVEWGMADPDEKLHAWISMCSDVKQLRICAENAESKGRLDLRDEALKRSWTLEGLNHSDPLHRDFYAMLNAYEHYLYEKHGKNLKAQYTRRALANKGVIGTLNDWALASKPTDGFKRLVAANLAEFTGECVIMRHAERFSESIVAAAKKRLGEFGISNCGQK
jgi:hypothetical protein